MNEWSPWLVAKSCHLSAPVSSPGKCDENCEFSLPRRMIVRYNKVRDVKYKAESRCYLIIRIVIVLVISNYPL